MKTINKLALLAGLAGGLLATTAVLAVDEPPTNAPAADPAAQAPAQPAAAPAADGAAPEQVAQPGGAPASGAATAQPAAIQSQDVDTNSTADFPEGKGLRMNFRHVPMEQVLNYMSKAAGFVIHPRVSISGTVDAWSDNPLTKEEALDLLEHVLDDNGYTVLRDGKILTIISKTEAVKSNLPVKMFSSVDSIPQNSEVVTYIVPVRTLNPVALVKNLQPLLSTGPDSNLQANESANSLLITDTQLNIRRIASIVVNLDSVSAGINTIKVYKLTNADAKSVSSLIKDLFPSQNSTQNGQGGFTPGGFGRTAGGGRGGRGGGGGPGGFAGFPGGGNPFAALLGGPAGGDSQGTTPSSRIAAVSDDHSNSVIVSAPEDVISTIDDLIRQLDQPVEDITVIRVIQLKHADPNEMANLLANLFPDPTNPADASGSRFQLGGFGRFGGPQPGRNNAAATAPSEYSQKMGHVSAVADARTQSLIVTAAKSLMPQIEEMVAQLDSIDAGRMQAFSVSLQNADPQDVLTVLQDLYPNNNSRSTSTQNNPLQTRQTTVLQNQLTSGAGSGSGNTTSSSGGRGGGLQ